MIHNPTVDTRLKEFFSKAKEVADNIQFDMDYKIL